MSFGALPPVFHLEAHVGCRDQNAAPSRGDFTKDGNIHPRSAFPVAYRAPVSFLDDGGPRLPLVSRSAPEAEFSRRADIPFIGEEDLTPSETYDPLEILKPLAPLLFRHRLPPARRTPVAGLDVLRQGGPFVTLAATPSQIFSIISEFLRKALAAALCGHFPQGFQNGFRIIFHVNPLRGGGRVLERLHGGRQNSMLECYRKITWQDQVWARRFNRDRLR